MPSRDVIQISLGSSANAVTAHFLNLQGLAVTDSHDECDAPTTHRLEQNHWVPRCLLVDEPTRFFASSQVSQMGLLRPQSKSFAIQPLDTSLTLQHVEQNVRSQQYQSISSTLAYSTQSRYYREPAAVQPIYRASQDNARHVNWDDMGSDEEEEEEQVEDEEQHRLRKQEEYTNWTRETLEPLHARLLEVIEEESSIETREASLTWMDYWMPPYSDRSNVALEYSHQSQLTPHWDSYHPHSNSNGNDSDWMEDVLFDRLRRLLEESDSCQGVMITTQGHGIYAGLTTALLHQLQQETKSAGRLVFHINNPQSNISTENDEADTQNQSWQPAHVERVRQHVSFGLALHDFTQNAHGVIPLKLAEDRTSLFQASAQVAIALEASTLPIRLASSSNIPRRIGLTNAPFLGERGEYDMQWGSTAQRLTMSEYIQCIVPSSQYKLLELDTLSSAAADNEQLWQALLSGTSLERDARVRDTGNGRFRPRDVPPGGWLQDSSTKNGPGLLTCLSPNPSPDPRFRDRSLHHHFALSTAVRPARLEYDTSDPRYQYDPTAETLPHYLTATIQGMGIAHRPERSVATIGPQSIGQLTFASPTSGGAGAYWKSLLASVEQPTLAVLGNTTRIFPHLHQVSSDMKLVMGSRYRGYYQRDVLNGVFPEAEDCQEAMEGCFGLRDVYHPPDGSGLTEDNDDIDI